MKTDYHLCTFGLILLLAFNENNGLQVVNVQTLNVTDDTFLDYDDYGKDYSHVGSLKFHLIEDKIPKVVTEICMHNMICPIRNCGVSLVDVIEATQLSRFDTSTLVAAIEKLNIDPNDAYNIRLIYDLTPDLFEYFLHTFGVTFSDIYKNFVSSLATPSKSIPEILNTLNVSVVDFMNAQAYGNDTLRLQVLSYGNYSKQNLLSVMKIANKTASDMLRLIPLNTAVKQISKLNPLEFTNFIKNLGVTSESLDVFYKYLGITPINFLSYPLFIQLITELYDELNPEEVLATFVSPNMLATSNKATALKIFKNQTYELARKYANFKFELVENPLVQYAIDSVKEINPEYKSKDVAFIKVKNTITTGFADIPKDYNNASLSKCTYVSKLPYGGLYIENVTKAYMERDRIVIAKTANTIYNLGSPLFCNDTLYGSAVEDGMRNIYFFTFLGSTPTTGKPVPIIPPIIKPPLGNGSSGTNGTHTKPNGKPSKASSLFVSNIVINIVIGFVITKFTVCVMSE